MSVTDEQKDLMLQYACLQAEIKKNNRELELDRMIYFTEREDWETDIVFDNGDGKTQIRFTPEGEEILEVKQPTDPEEIRIYYPT